jgi:hypothetical protein
MTHRTAGHMTPNSSVNRTTNKLSSLVNSALSGPPAGYLGLWPLTP